MPEYIDFAKQRIQKPEITFKVEAIDHIAGLITEFGMPDLLYMRMSIMHAKNPLVELEELLKHLNSETLIALEEPDIQAYAAEPHNKYFQEFVDLIMCYGGYRQEDYSIGKKLISLIQNLQQNILISQEQQAILQSEDTKKIFTFLLGDLIPIFAELGLAELDSMQRMQKFILTEVIENPKIKIKHCKLTQLLFRKA